MADDLSELKKAIDDLDNNVEKVPHNVAKALGVMGKDEVTKLAVAVFGGDRKFSGAKKSATAKKAATVKYRLSGDDVVVLPSGDPFYIFMKGRGRKVIMARSGRALRLPDGSFRRQVVGGRLAPRPDLLDPAISRIGDQAPKIIADGILDAGRKAGFS